MKKRKGLSFLLAVLMLLLTVLLSAVPVSAAGGTVEVSTWEELKRALEYTTNCSVVKVVINSDELTLERKEKKDIVIHKFKKQTNHRYE